jgi:hypothetical protein
VSDKPGDVVNGWRLTERDGWCQSEPPVGLDEQDHHGRRCRIHPANDRETC